jgi:hypothetical protein
MALSDHLTICKSCQQEEQHFRAIQRAGKEMNTYKVSEGFNNQLLDRIAHERFAETRTKAYLPKAAPSQLLRRLVPAVVTAALVVFVGMNFYSPQNQTGSDMKMAGGSRSIDDSYLTAQPLNNPNLTGTLNKGWSLDAQLARSERINRISNQLTFNSPFSLSGGNSNVNVTTRSFGSGPFVSGFYRIRPVIRIFHSPHSITVKEGQAIY